MLEPTIKLKDLVSTKPDVWPPKFCQEVEKMVQGERTVFYVERFPYFKEELTLELPWVE